MVVSVAVGGLLVVVDVPSAVEVLILGVPLFLIVLLAVWMLLVGCLSLEPSLSPGVGVLLGGCLPLEPSMLPGAGVLPGWCLTLGSSLSPVMGVLLGGCLPL